MKVAGRLSALAVFCALSVSTGVVFAQAKMPQGEFVCQVKDVDGETRFVGIQASDLSRVQEIAQGKSKWAVPAGRELVECINPKTQTFKSRSAQKQYREDVR
ncbi:hypothetical protein [Haliea salexigens]|uniref:hypothetical protein n=1 Tax=Haliea salexigens TaxID=287487 RepID=UPI00040E6F21|nr:hypothetical protein [Haliea salexigens]